VTDDVIILNFLLLTGAFVLIARAFEAAPAAAECGGSRAMWACDASVPPEVRQHRRKLVVCICVAGITFQLQAIILRAVT
jgi:hypothetical protein